ncbi:PP2C family protein-serine/threonine phosphatase [Melioribacteraceae bacterium 4301-Me]|uniref:PP2C family protein-serine/threonine phosphatase n=1 Tax=Pyranulibacter aquaticus TaxID=3163344 RepID=UPI0035992686
MDQKRLYRTIETAASKNFVNEKELLSEVVKQIVESDLINVTGGRVWKLDPVNKQYKLLFQTGKVAKIPENYTLNVNDYPVLSRITSERTILADETDSTLISKGIFRYSASGVGRKIKIDGSKYYEYLLAVNSPVIDEDLRYTLNIVATVLTSKLNERFLSLSQKKLISDIDKAKQLQRSILPEHEYHFKSYEIFGVTIPAETVGGDFYDYLKIGDEDDRLGIAVGDAASKGLAAAAEAMYISGALRMATTFQMKIAPMMKRLNQLINKIFSDDRFTSLFYGELSIDKKGLFLYVNAGHNPPIFYNRENDSFTYLQPTGPLIGPVPNSRFETDSINFSNGDILVIYTDGITESANEKYEMYETKRLEEIIKKTVDLSPKEIATAILDDVIKFTTNESRYQDDKTVVVIKRKG